MAKSKIKTNVKVNVKEINNLIDENNLYKEEWENKYFTLSDEHIIPEKFFVKYKNWI